ncbi:MAG: polyprenyl diphosphate synthase [Candidatus Nanoarchaeia archaeon]|jgi:tritrans,polycis-undecaprenyl-diphosphate synthase [geranylgeranyl-diphosphate specific]|nr:polyprenyl diphosphate synthase [Candidatus Nanoarchaeia archaeon]|tara:strand:- start:37713 stop:38408 length:696 start_codon:yes stop_codon:yes gene_type:complete
MRVPNHIGIVLDGNRRFAKKLVLKPWMGHEWGAKKVEKLLDWSKELGVKELTLYAFSIQNFNRPKEEFNFLMDLFKKEFGRLLNDKRLDEDKIKVNFIGRIWKFPQELREIMAKIMYKTKDYGGYIVNFAMAYGGREEVLDAVKKIGDKIKEGEIDVENINEKVFSEELYTDHEPELIIRTGGEKRTSNFLIWQSHYSEWIFLEKTWPEFEKEDLVNAIKNFSERERRFGK